MALPAAGRKRDRPGACRIAWSGVVRLSVFHHWAGSDATAAGAAGIAASLARGLTQEELNRLAAFFHCAGGSAGPVRPGRAGGAAERSPTCP